MARTLRKVHIDADEQLPPRAHEVPLVAEPLPAELMPELGAMQVCAAELQALEPEARVRVLWWLVHALGLGHVFTGGEEPRP